MARQALLGDDEQRVAFGAADGVRERVVQLGLVRVVRVRGRVMFGDHGDIVRSDTEPRQIMHELGIAATHAGGERTKTRSRD